MFINEALAQTAATGAAAEAAPEGTGMRLFIQFLLIFGIFYLVLIRPQTKRMKEHKNRISTVKVGDKVVCAGIFGRVAKILNDSEIEVEIADGVKVKMLKDLVSEVNPDAVSAKPVALADAKENKNPNSKADKLKSVFGKK